MNQFIKYFSIIGILFCLALTFILYFRTDLIKDFSRDYLNKRLVSPTQKAAEAVQSTWVPLLEQYKAPQEITAYIQAEANNCLKDPKAYISNLTDENSIKEFKEFSISNPTLQKLIPKKIFFYNEIRTHFKNSYNNLLNSLRLFFISNLLGLLTCLYFQIKNTSDKALNIPSYLMFISLIYSTSAFIDQNFLFDLILNNHMGIWYPILLLSTFIKLMLKRRKKDFKDEVNETIKESVQNFL